MSDKSRKPKERIISDYIHQYENSPNKFESVQQLISIKKELIYQNKKTSLQIWENINRHKSVHGDEAHWIQSIIEVFKKSTNGLKTIEDSQDRIIEQMEELNHNKIRIKSVKNILRRCSYLADNKRKENLLDTLIRTITNHDFPSSLEEYYSKDKLGNNNNLAIQDPHYQSVNNIIHEMAAKRSGPDERSRYEYDDVFNALTKKYNNPDLRYKDLNTPINETTFSSMWTILKKAIKEIDTKELD